MPREIVHWEVLHLAVHRISPESAPTVKKVLTTFFDSALLGAISHDAPYYLFFGRDRAFEMLAESLHGSYREDTFDPMRALAKNIVTTSSPAVLWSFLLGMVSHGVTDIVFHPMVYYFTGDYYHPDRKERTKAQSRHRLFEVYLDSWFRESLKIGRKGRIAEVMKNLGDDFLSICELLEQTLVPEKLPTIKESVPSEGEKTNRWQKSFLYISVLQRLFLSPLLGLIIRTLNKGTGGLLNPIDSLFLFLRKRPQQYFETPLQYKNPVTGEERRESVLEMKEEAVKRCVEIFTQFEPLLSGKENDIDKVLGGLRGDSLNVGVYRVDSSSYKHFSPHGADLPGLSF